jgi:hypothetical protein
MEKNSIYEAYPNASEFLETTITPYMELEDTEEYQDCEKVVKEDFVDISSIEESAKRRSKNPQHFQRRIGRWLSHNIIEENRSLNTFVRLAAIHPGQQSIYGYPE